MIRNLEIGSKINEWTIISEPIIKNGKNHRNLKCSCGNEYFMSESYINKSIFSKSCRSCSQIRRRNDDGKRVYNVGDILMNLEIIKIDHGKNIVYAVKCLKCGHNYRTGHSILNKKKNEKGLSFCHNCYNGETKSKRKFCMLTKNISLTLYKKLLHQAEIRGIEFTVTPEYLESIFKGYCYLSGTNINIGTYSNTNGIYDLGNSSLDRIDSNIGYVENNVAWVFRPINVMKHILNVNDFIELCTKIGNFNKKPFDI